MRWKDNYGIKSKKDEILSQLWQSKLTKGWNYGILIHNYEMKGWNWQSHDIKNLNWQKVMTWSQTWYKIFANLMCHLINKKTLVNHNYEIIVDISHHYSFRCLYLNYFILSLLYSHLISNWLFLHPQSRFLNCAAES